jgi:hypothetical protein
MNGSPTKTAVAIAIAGSASKAGIRRVNINAANTAKINKIRNPSIGKRIKDKG